MNVARLGSIGFAVLLALLPGAGCNRSKRASSEWSATPTPQAFRASVTAHAPDAFYDPPSDVPREPGELLRSEPLKDVTLPPGVRGWRIPYATTVDDSTPATAVATVFAPSDTPARPRPVIAWEHGTTGLLQKCMPSLLSTQTKGVPERDRIITAGWVVIGPSRARPPHDHPTRYTRTRSFIMDITTHALSKQDGRNKEGTTQESSKELEDEPSRWYPNLQSKVVVSYN